MSALQNEIISTVQDLTCIFEAEILDFTFIIGQTFQLELQNLTFGFSIILVNIYKN